MVEIERKFLVLGSEWRQDSIQSEAVIYQAYLFEDEQKSIRIRVKSEKAFLTIKMGKGISRHEFEYHIPKDDALKMIEQAHLPCLEKTRYEVLFEGNTWEVDVFHGKFEGLVLAEIELSNENQVFAKPTWVGQEVTFDPEYLNVNLFKQL